jgi:glycerol kinase
MQYILAIDQGTTSTRAVVFNALAQPQGFAQKEFTQYFPRPGWVEHDSEEIWQTVLECCQQAIKNANVSVNDITVIGITNQRETTIIWDRKTGKPIYNAIVWQDRRTAELCEKIKQTTSESFIQEKTGLLIDPYFSATKIAWLLDQVPDARKQAKNGELAFGTIDTFLLWRFTNGKVHATDITNASRTSLLNIHNGEWDAELLNLFAIPQQILPKVLENCADFGKTNLFGKEIPITAMAGDQQASLVGQACFTPGMLKSTYGTGAFIMLNTGAKIPTSKNRLLTTIAYSIHGNTAYALEGSIFSAGSIVQWLRDQLKVIQRAGDSEQLAKNIPDNHGVYFVPAFTGLGAPHWNPHIRGMIYGLTRATGVPHIVRAGLEAVAYQTNDLITAMQKDISIPITELRVDGGMTANNWLMQFLSDILNLTLKRPVYLETTAIGIAYLAGLGADIYNSLEQVAEIWQQDRQFKPSMSAEQRDRNYLGWKQALEKV